MKLEVIGWTYYDDFTYEEGPVDEASYNAVLDEVVKRGYLFTGWHHQESLDCAPVLNDGKIRRFSARSWGGLMARSQGMTGKFDYSAYAFYTGFSDEESFKFPGSEAFLNEEKILTPEELREEYTVKTNGSYLSKIGKLLNRTLPDLPEYRYMAEGDVIVFKCGKAERRYMIKNFEKAKKLSLNKIREYESSHYLYDTEDKRRKKIEKRYEEAPLLIRLELEAI